MPANLIPEDHAEKICKPFQEGCCRYLTRSPSGWECAKNRSGWKKLLDQRVALGEMRATGDNCEGIGPKTETPIPPSLADIIRDHSK